MIIIPTLFSLLRILLTPIVVVLLICGGRYIPYAVFVFTIAALTDAIDGYLARLYKVTSFWGSFLDPLADKILIGSTLACFASREIIGWWIVMIILVRDITMTLLRLIARAQGLSLKTTMLAKVKTVLQFVLMYTIFFWLIAHDVLQISRPDYLLTAITVGTYCIVVITLYTGLDYVMQLVRLRGQE